METFDTNLSDLSVKRRAIKMLTGHALAIGSSSRSLEDSNVRRYFASHARSTPIYWAVANVVSIEKAPPYSDVSKFMGNTCTVSGSFTVEQLPKEKMAASTSSSASLKTVVFLGSTREGRFGLRVAKFIKKHLEKAGHSVDVLG